MTTNERSTYWLEDPTPAVLNIELWLCAEFIYKQFAAHTETIAALSEKSDELAAVVGGRSIPAA